VAESNHGVLHEQCRYFLAQRQQNFAGAGCLLAQLYLKNCASKIYDAPAKFKMRQQNH
jgi:hypothetical protein